MSRLPTRPKWYYEGKRALATDECPYGYADLTKRQWWLTGQAEAKPKKIK